jgi:hypothetical protein
MAWLIRAAGLRWPVEEDFGFSKDCFGVHQSQVRLCTAIARHRTDHGGRARLGQLVKPLPYRRRDVAAWPL